MLCISLVVTIISPPPFFSFLIFRFSFLSVPLSIYFGSVLFFLLVLLYLQVFFRASLAILQLSEPRLLELDMESILLFLSRFPQDGILDKETLVPTALAIKVRHISAANFMVSGEN